MSTWYRIGRGCDPHITPVEVLSHTKMKLTLAPTSGLNGWPKRILYQRGEWYSFFPSWEEAQQELIRRYTEKLEELERSHSHHSEGLLQVRGLQRPHAEKSHGAENFQDGDFSKTT